MDAGGLAGAADGQVLTVWMRKKETFTCKPGERERSWGKGEQACVAAGPDGFHVLWLAGRPGPLMALLPEWSQPRKLADQANDPAVAAAVSGKGPVVAVWEEGRAGSIRLQSQVLYPAR